MNLIDDALRGDVNSLTLWSNIASIVAAIAIIVSGVKWWCERPRMDIDAFYRPDESNPDKKIFKISCVQRGRFGARIHSIRAIKTSRVDRIYRFLFLKRRNLSSELAIESDKIKFSLAPVEALPLTFPMADDLVGWAQSGNLAVRVHTTVGTFFAKVPQKESPALNQGPD